jgi:hypothetical protein
MPDHHTRHLQGTDCSSS